MRKVTFLLLAMLGMTLQSMGQIPFGVGFPSPTNFVKVMGTGVNIRKAPSTSSPRLVFRDNVSDDCMDCDPSLAWASGALKKGDKPVNPQLLYIRGESGDWWYVKFYEDAYGDGGYSEMGYIMKKFCKSLTPKNLPTTPPRDKHIIILSSGKYQGMCIEWLYGYYDRQVLRIGRYIDGVYAFAYSVEFSKNYRETNETLFEYINSQYTISFGVNLFDSNNELDLHKLANDTKALDYIVENRDKMTSDDVTYLGFEGDSKWYKWGN